MSTDHQIAEKIISAVKDSDGWRWIVNKGGSLNSIAKGKLKVQAVKEMSPGDPWDYTHVYVDDIEWQIPPTLKKEIWEAAWPNFELAEMRYREQLNAHILSKLL